LCCGTPGCLLEVCLPPRREPHLRFEALRCPLESYQWSLTGVLCVSWGFFACFSSPLALSGWLLAFFGSPLAGLWPPVPPFRCPLAPFGSPLGDLCPPFASLGLFWVSFGRSLALFGSLRVAFGRFLAPFGSPWPRLWVLFSLSVLLCFFFCVPSIISFTFPPDFVYTNNVISSS